METINSTINNEIIIAEQLNINNSATVFNSKSIQILHDDCLISILFYLDKIEDIASCKSLNKRFFYVIDNLHLLEKLVNKFFKKHCSQPERFCALSQRYLLSINNQLSIKPKKIDSYMNYLNNIKENIELKKKLFFSIEQRLLKAEEISLQIIANIEHNKTINTMSFSQDNKFFATASNDKTVKIHQFTDGVFQQVCLLNHDIEIKNILFSPDNNYIITSSYYRHIIWGLDTKTCGEITIIENLNKSDIYFRSDSQRLFIKSKDHPIKIFDLIANKWILVLSINYLEFCSSFNLSQGKFNDQLLYLSTSIKQDSWLAFIMKRHAISSILTKNQDYGDDFFADSIKKMVFGTRSQELGVDFISSVNVIAYSNDMRLIYVHSFVSRGIILEYINNQWQLKLKLKAGGDIQISFSSDNQRLISRNDDDSIQGCKTTVWNISGNQAYAELILENTQVAKFSADGKYLIAADLNKQIIIWHFIDDTWKIKSAIQNEQFIFDVCFSNYNWMIAKSSSNTVTILEIVSSNYELNI